MVQTALVLLFTVQVLETPGNAGSGECAHVCLCVCEYTCEHEQRGQAMSRDLFKEKEQTQAGGRLMKAKQASSNPRNLKGNQP